MPLSIVETKKQIVDFVEENGTEEFILKPVIGASAIGLQRFCRNQIPEIKKPMILQKFYPEILMGEVSLIYFNKNYSYAVKKVPKNGDIRVQEEYGGIISAYNPNKKERDMANKIIRLLPQETLYARIDIVPNVGIIEVECIEPALYFSFYENAADMMVKEICHLL
jgi:glutathione synthase/RimK-type ligase-like ATP-grasp enzyme